MPALSKNELLARVTMVRKQMEEQGLSCVVTMSYDSSYYLSGVPTPDNGRAHVAIIPLDGEAALVLDSPATEDGEEHSWIKDRRTYTDIEHPRVVVPRIVREVLQEKKLDRAKIGVTPVNWVYDALKETLPDAKLVDITDVLERLKDVKTPEEVKLYRKSAKLVDIGTEAALKAAKVGVTELEVAAAADSAVMKAASKMFPELGIETTVNCQAGLRTLNIHSPATGKRIRRGDLVEVDVFLTAWGYRSVEEVIAVVGKPSSAQLKAYKVAEKAHQGALNTIGPGVKCSAVDAAARKVYEEAGYKEAYRHMTGHNLGMASALPRYYRLEFRDYVDRMLVEGNMLSVEPGLYIPGLGGFRHCDMILVTNSGCEVLTKYDKYWKY